MITIINQMTSGFDIKPRQMQEGNAYISPDFPNKIFICNRLDSYDVIAFSTDGRAIIWSSSDSLFKEVDITISITGFGSSDQAE